MSQELFDKVIEGVTLRCVKYVRSNIDLLSETNVCGSPIEVALGIALIETLRVGGTHIDGCRYDAVKEFPENATLLVAQYQFQTYCIDWAFIHESHILFIECDGHEFHERTKEQAAHDRKRDRIIQDAGIKILRFTGSEIFKNPLGCVDQIVNSMNILVNASIKNEVEKHGQKQRVRVKANSVRVEAA